MYIIYSMLYALLIGFYNVFKKISTSKKTEPSAILAIFTTICFLLAQIWIPFGIAIPPNYIWIFAVKGFIISLSWFITLKVLKNADLSLVVATNILSIVLTFVAGIVLFNESISAMQIVGSVLIVFGITVVNLLNRKAGKTNLLTILLLILTAFISTGSEIIDKYTTLSLSNFQVQYWFLLFVCVFSWIIFATECLIKKEFLIKSDDFKNFWIYLVALFLFVGDLTLFLAYKQPKSQMIIISIVSKLKIIVTMFSGIIIFKEKDVTKKILLTLLIVLGAIFVSVF